MLLNYNPNKTLYIVGTGIPAVELRDWIANEDPNLEIVLIERQQLKNLPDNSQCIPGFANRRFRSEMVNDPLCKNHTWVSYVHPSSVLIATAKIGAGTVIHPMSVIGHNVIIGNFGWITPYCLLSHGDILGNNVVLSPRVIVGGTTTIGDNVTIGLSSTICDKISICSDCEFLMTSVVTKNIVVPGIYVGNKKKSATL